MRRSRLPAATAALRRGGSRLAAATSFTRPTRLLAATTLLVACGEESAPDVARLLIDPAATMVVGVGATAAFRVVAYDSSGRSTSAGDVTWSTDAAEVASVSASGLATGLGAGTARIIAELGSVADTATFEVWVAPTVEAYHAGTSYSGRADYVEYIPGTLPVVVSAPHGGALTPDEIPDRTWGTLVTDAYTEQTIRAVREAFLERTGEAPHVVISHLKRTKLDPNREIGEAAQESPFAENAWGEFHGFIEIATERVQDDFGAGLYLDLHGHGHEIQRLELGYLLSAGDLNQSDSELNGGSFVLKSSVASLAQASPLTLSELVRGETSFGAYLAEESVRSVPSPGEPSPGSDAYFSGGYNTARHGSRNGGSVDGIQLELHRPGVRDTDENRRLFAARLAWVVERFMLEHYGFFGGGG